MPGHGRFGSERVIYRAAAAYPYVDADHAATALREQLRLMALAGGGTPDWSTLLVEGPTEWTGLHGPTWFEWTATLSADGGRDLTRDQLDDDLLSPAVTAALTDSTMPQTPIA